MEMFSKSMEMKNKMCWKRYEKSSFALFKIPMCQVYHFVRIFHLIYAEIDCPYKKMFVRFVRWIYLNLKYLLCVHSAMTLTCAVTQ